MLFMNVIIGSDHAGYELKEEIKKHLSSEKIKVDDLGSINNERCDYPDYAARVATKVQKTGNIGILICGTGIGMCISANKFKGIRAALCNDEYTAQMAREHNNANILCMGGRTTSPEIGAKIAEVFLNTKPSTDERHVKRVKKISELEKDNFK
jgi:ribose 5-phosphate isomerase B